MQNSFIKKKKSQNTFKNTVKPDPVSQKRECKFLPGKNSHEVAHRRCME